MSGLSRFDFYPRDWHLGTRNLTSAEKGFYIDILAAMYARGGPLPYDETELCNLTGCKTVRSMRPLLQKLIEKKKFVIRDGHVFNDRAQDEIAKANTRIENARKGGKARSRPVPAEYEPNTTRTQAVTRPGNGQFQGDSVCIPSPSPPIVTSKSDYAFFGKVIKLTQNALTTWQNSYSAIPDIRASLQSRDDWLAAEPEEAKRSWFISTSNWLVKENRRAKVERGDQEENQQGSGAIG